MDPMMKPARSITEWGELPPPPCAVREPDACRPGRAERTLPVRPSQTDDPDMGNVTWSHGHRRGRAVMALVLASAAAACGGSDSSGVTTDPVTVTDVPTTDVPTTDATLDDVQAAVIRIETSGSYVEPDESLLQPVESLLGGNGTGFIIDPSGDRGDEPARRDRRRHHRCLRRGLRRAGVGPPPRLLGMLRPRGHRPRRRWIHSPGWYDGEIEPGLEIFVAGFPLGDEEYTLLDGIVSKARADGESSWASVDWAIEYTAPIQPANSGGPLVTSTGEVVAVNYAYSQPGTGTPQYFAIARELAMPLVDELQDGGGDDFTTGVSGRAVVDEATGVAGVWVSAVDAGSPADEAGCDAWRHHRAARRSARRHRRHTRELLRCPRISWTRTRCSPAGAPFR